MKLQESNVKVKPPFIRTSTTDSGGRVPHLDPSHLQSFLKKKKEKDAGGSRILKEGGGDVAYSIAQPATSSKRKRDDAEKSLEVLSEGDKVAIGGDKSVFDR
ncbi:uncharacterized protein [Arachis hypogaea]|uniref:uncharacterized protein n=1 Tax=Arachis hypogaea TaxID=3818 RepID=UPI003B2137F9